MQQCDFLGDSVGRLGFGAMRLPVIGENQADIDQDALNEMVDIAIEGGINYFDTAYPYHGGMSEVALCKSLSRYPRNSYLLADKYPGHQIAKEYHPEEIFENQLEKCNTDYFDFYLLHNVYENSINVYTDEKWGIIDYFIEQKKRGRIRHLGFSSHGRPDCLQAFLDYANTKYSELSAVDASMFAKDSIMEFCQIQLNYLDFTLQRADEKCEMLKSAGLPIVVMEPLRGGKLATLEPEKMDKLKKLRPDTSAAEWSFRWLQDIPDVKVVLSGMSNATQVRENCAAFSPSASLTDDERVALSEVAETLKGGVPCTACRYCTDGCPQGIDIPQMLEAYNDLSFDTSFTVAMAMEAIQPGRQAADCIDCRKCKHVCPQGINIPQVLSDLAAQLEKLPKWSELCRQRDEEAAKLREKR